MMMTETHKKTEPAAETEQIDARLDGLDPNASISRKLRDYYGALQEESIPDRFLDLLERLDQAERRTQAAGKS